MIAIHETITILAPVQECQGTAFITYSKW